MVCKVHTYMSAEPTNQTGWSAMNIIVVIRISLVQNKTVNVHI